MEQQVSDILTLRRICKVYQGMMSRCFNSNTNGFHRYGGRGITVCQEWRKDRQKFIEWASYNGYEHGLQIDRINNDGDYEPENCRWVTPKQNCRNTSRTLFMQVNGERKPVIEISEQIGLSTGNLLKKVNEQKIDDLTLTDLSKRLLEMAHRKRTNTKHFKMQELKEIINAHFIFFEMKG